MSAARHHAQRFLRRLIAAHPMPIHAPGERRVGAPELVHHRARIDTERDDQPRTRALACAASAAQATALRPPPVAARSRASPPVRARAGECCWVRADGRSRSGTRVRSARPCEPPPSATAARRGARASMSICRTPASVQDARTVIRPAVRSTSRHRRSSRSRIRTPASTSVARIARRGTCWRSLRPLAARAAARSQRRERRRRGAAPSARVMGEPHPCFGQGPGSVAHVHSDLWICHRARYGAVRRSTYRRHRPRRCGPSSTADCTCCCAACR
jgi:hypothetical protein